MDLKKTCSLIALVICVCALVVAFIMLVAIPNTTTIHNDPAPYVTSVQSAPADSADELLKKIKTDYTIEDINALAIAHFDVEQISVMYDKPNNNYSLFIDYTSDNVDLKCNIFNKPSITELYNALLSYISKKGNL